MSLHLLNHKMSGEQVYFQYVINSVNTIKKIVCDSEYCQPLRTWLNFPLAILDPLGAM